MDFYLIKKGLASTISKRMAHVLKFIRRINVKRIRLIRFNDLR